MTEERASQLLSRAINNDDNASLEGLTTSKIKSIKNDVLQQLQLSRAKLLDMHRKLKEYRFVGDLDSLRYGSYVRWINLNDSSLKLTNGGIVCDMQVQDKGLIIKCRNRFHRIFQFCMDECLVFQKFSEQETILLAALDYLNS
jgi:hypothetical protein